MQPAWKRWLVISLVGIAIFAFTYFYRGVFDYFGLSDAALLPGAILLSIAGLRLIFRTGVYDVTGYGLSKFADSFKRSDKANYQSVYEYQEVKNLKRKNQPFVALPYFVVGGIFILLSYIFSMLALGG
jgi:uncharacterized membrane protein